MVPEVNRINASSVPDAKLAADCCAAFAEPTSLKAHGPSLGRGDRSITGMPRLRATTRLAESKVCTRQQRRYPQIAEITLPFVSGEARVKRHTDRTCGDRDNRNRSLWSVRQYNRDPVISAYTEAPQLRTTSFAGPRGRHMSTRRALAPGWQCGRASFRP